MLQQETRDNLNLAASVFRAVREGIFITDLQHRIIDVNPAFTALVGRTVEEMRGQTPRAILPESNAEQVFRAVTAALRENNQWEGEVWVQRRDGECFPSEMFVSAVRDEEGNITHHITVFSDISQRKAHEEELERIAHFDPLTGIPNRRLLTDRLNQALAHAQRTDTVIAVCMLDLDGFKPVNDAHGHEAGDCVLKDTAKRLQSLIRAEDTVARLGGDEFVLVLRQPEGETVFHRVLREINQPIRLPGGEVCVSASMGVAYCDGRHGCDGDLLLRRADQAAYRAKSSGKNCFRTYPS